MTVIRSIVAMLLLLAIISQTVIRLNWGLSENLISPSGTVLHLVTLAAIFGVGFWLLTLENRKLSLIAATCWFGIAHNFLILMDLGLFAAPRFAGIPLTFPFVMDVACGGRFEWDCVANYSAIALGFVASFLFFLGIYAIAIVPMRAIALATANIAPRFQLRQAALLGVATVVIANVAFWQQWSNRDPLHALFVKEFIKGPPGLSTNTRETFDRGTVAAEPVAVRPLILIVVDAMRFDAAIPGSALALSMPFLHSLQTSGRLVSYGPAVTTCTMSFCGITSLLSSRYWSQLKRPPLTISDELARYGYQSHYLLSGDHRRFFNMRTIYGPNISTFVDEQDGTSGKPSNDNDLLPHMRSLKLRDPDRSFVYLHLKAAHAIGWKPGIEGEVRELAMAALTGRNDEQTRSAYRRQYTAGLRQADKMIKAMFAELGRRDLLDRALVIIVADHGERLGENGRFGHGAAPDKEVALVPLLVFDPLNKAYPRRKVISTVDVAPTLLDAIGVPIPRKWSGTALQKRVPDRRIAIDSEDSAAYVVGAGDMLLMRRCNIATGAMSKIALTENNSDIENKDPLLSTKTVSRAVNAPRRADSGRCSF